MAKAFVCVLPLATGIAGLVAGWACGQFLEVTGFVDTNALRTDPENFWAWCALLSGLAGVAFGGLAAWAIHERLPR